MKGGKSTKLSAKIRNFFRPDKYAAMSVDARQELDLKIGVSFSRLMTRKQQKYCTVLPLVLTAQKYTYKCMYYLKRIKNAF